MYTKNFVNPCPDWATALLNGFSQVLLLRNPLVRPVLPAGHPADRPRPWSAAPSLGALGRP